MGVTVRFWKGAWWVFVRHKKQRKAKRAGDKATAVALARAIRLRLGQDGFSLGSTPDPGPTFAAFAEDWLERYPIVQAVSPGTRENYTSALRQHLLPYFGAFPVAAITPDTVEAFVVAKRSRGGSVRFNSRPLGDGHRRNLLVLLRLILERAVTLGHLPRQPGPRCRALPAGRRGDCRPVRPVRAARGAGGSNEAGSSLCHLPHRVGADGATRG
jgi:hypothetical protein